MEFTFICLVANSPASPSNGNVKQSLVLSRTCWQIIPHLIIMIIAWSECQSRERKCFRQDCWNNRLTTRPTVGEWFIPKTVNQITASLAEEEGPARNKVAFNAPTDWSLCWSTSCGEAPLFTYLFAACARITCIEVNFCRGCDWSGWSGVRWDGTDGLQSPKPTDCQSPGAETQSTALALGQWRFI